MQTELDLRMHGRARNGTRRHGGVVFHFYAYLQRPVQYACVSFARHDTLATSLHGTRVTTITDSRFGFLVKWQRNHSFLDPADIFTTYRAMHKLMSTERVTGQYQRAGIGKLASLCNALAITCRLKPPNLKLQPETQTRTQHSSHHT